MKFKLQMVAVEEDGKENNVQEITLLEKEFKSIEDLGMSLAESKEILKQIQSLILSQQVAAYLRKRFCCKNYENASMYTINNAGYFN